MLLSGARPLYGSEDHHGGCVLKSAMRQEARRGEAGRKTPPTTEALACTRGGASLGGSEATILAPHVHRLGFGLKFWASIFVKWDCDF